MSFEDVQSAIEEIAKNSQNDLLIIRGAWGVGKTYFWEHLIKRLRDEKTLALENYAYVSLFGVNDITTVKNQISASLILNKLSSSAGDKSRWRTFLQKDAINEAQKAAEQLPYVKWLPIGLANEAAFMLAKECIICIDDIERKDAKLTIKEVLGLAALLKEQRRCKVVFILNEDNLTPEERKEFNSYNEKLVDWSFDFAPTPDSVFAYVFPPASDDCEFIRDLCLRLGIRNIRILKRISSFLRLLARHSTGLQEAVRQDLIRSVILYVWCLYDRERERPSFEFLENYASLLFEVRQRTGNSEDLDREKAFHDLLVQYGYEMTDDVDRELIKFVRSGVLEVESFIRVLKDKLSNRERAEAEQAYRDAWKLYRGHFGDNEKEFLDKLKGSFYMNLNELGLGELQAVAEVFRYFGRQDVATKLITDFVAARITLENLDQWKTWRTLSSVTDEEITSQMASVERHRPVRVISFEEAIQSVARGTPNDFLTDEVKVMENTPADKYYEYFKAHVGDEIYYVVDACLKLPQAKSQTVAALRKIKQESKIDKLRVNRLYQLDQYEDIRNPNSEDSPAVD